MPNEEELELGRSLTINKLPPIMVPPRENHHLLEEESDEDELIFETVEDVEVEEDQNSFLTS
jgi:hypothetical protein